MSVDQSVAAEEKRLFIDGIFPGEIRVVSCIGNRIDNISHGAAGTLKDSLFLAKVTRIEPGLGAVFVKYQAGDEWKDGFLPFSEVHPDYYDIPVADREQIKSEMYGNKSLPLTSDASPDNENSVEAMVGGSVDLGGMVTAPLRSAPVGGADSGAESQTESGSGLEEVDDVTTVNEAQSEIEVANFDVEGAQVKRYEFYKRYKVQEVIKRNQVMLVQVVKEERGNKGASLTTYISLAGRFCVLMPNSIKQGGISRKITNPEHRRRLKAVIDELNMPEGVGLIVRTAGEQCDSAEVVKDYNYLINLWENIKQRTFASRAPARIHDEGELIRRCIRDYFDKNIKEVVVQGDDSYLNVKALVKMMAPEDVHKVKHYRGKAPLFVRFKIEEELRKLYDHQVSLKSGAYLVINQAEALTAIDVNSGRATGERNIEGTALKTNLEAAQEIARQLRLRDIGGLIVIDFIDMQDYRHRQMVERSLREALSSDKARIQVGRISGFGLLEMSRQRLGSSFLETNSTTCRSCQGRGVVRSISSLAVSIMRALESELHNGNASMVTLTAHNDLLVYLLNNFRHYLSDLEQRYKLKLKFEASFNRNLDQFSVERAGKRELPKAEKSGAQDYYAELA